MSKFYSKSTRGFYSLDVHDMNGIPGDAVEISDEAWLELLNRQAVGMEIVPGTHGGPVAVDPDPAKGLLFQRDNALRDSDWLVARHRDEVEIDPRHTTLTPDQYVSLQAWRQQLRTLSSHPEFPRMSLPECPI